MSEFRRDLFCWSNLCASVFTSETCFPRSRRLTCTNATLIDHQGESCSNAYHQSRCPSQKRNESCFFKLCSSLWVPFVIVLLPHALFHFLISDKFFYMHIICTTFILQNKKEKKSVRVKVILLDFMSSRCSPSWIMFFNIFPWILYYFCAQPFLKVHISQPISYISFIFLPSIQWSSFVMFKRYIKSNRY